MIFECIRCQKFFDNKTHYNNHMRRKIPCKEVLNIKIDHDDIKEIEEESTVSKSFQSVSKVFPNVSIFRCVICDKIYKNRSGLFKHKKTKHPQKALLSRLSSLELLPNYEDEIKELNDKQKNVLKEVKEVLLNQAKQIDNLNKKNKELEILVKTSKSKKCIINNNTNNTNNTNNQTNNINNGQIINNHFNIVSFGDEDITKLTHEEKLSVLKSRYGALINLIKIVHLNERLPEFHNVLINNIKSNYGSIVDDNKLILRKKDKIIADIISSRLSDLKDLVNEYKQTKHLSRREKDIIDEMIIFAEHYQLEDEDIDGNIIKPDKNTLRKNKDIFDELIFAFYNNRSLIDRTLKKLTENNSMDMLLDV